MDKRATKRRKTFVDDEALESSGDGSDGTGREGSDGTGSDGTGSDGSEGNGTGSNGSKGSQHAVDNIKCVKLGCSTQAVYHQLCEECVDDARARLNKKERANYVNCSNVKCDAQMRARKLFYCTSCNKRPLCFDCVVGNVSAAPARYKCFRCLCPDVPGSVMDMWSDEA